MRKKLIIAFGIVTIMFVISLSIYFTIIFAGNSAIDNKKLVMDATTTIVDQNGNVVSKLYLENRQLVNLSQIPEHVQHAFIAMEDARFYDHRGIDFRAIGRALYRDIIARAKVEGGSTITQQLAKNTFLSSEKTWLRKTKEVVIAMNLERKFSKDELLEMYLNRIYFGHGAHGIQAASQLYFNKEVSELTIDEGALLASLPKAPNTYSPINNIEMSKARRDLTLSVMERRGYLTAEETVRLQGRTIKVDDNRITADNPAYLTYIDMVLAEAEEKYRLSGMEVLRGGYTIVVPIDIELQEKSYLKFQDPDFFPKSGPNQQVEAALVLMDNNSGGITSVLGGRQYVRKGINRVNVNRQPGSVMKPLVVYGPALESGQYEPYSLLKDELIDYNGYTPRNYNNRYDSYVTMYDALKYSANAPAVWLLNELSVQEGKKYLNDVNIPVNDEGLAIALGGLSEGLSPLQLAKAYRPFANNGKLVEPYFIEKIYDRNGNVVASVEQVEHQVISEQTAWYMTRMLEGVVEEGTGRHGNVNVALAGKTGTTSFEAVHGGVRDALFVGYTPKIVGAIWMGFDRTDEQHYLSVGSSLPTKLFKEIVNEIPHDDEFVAFSMPDGVNDLEPPIHFVQINDLSAALSFQGFRLNIKLTWTTSDDERLLYNIYEIVNGQPRLIDQVEGSGEYVIRGVNLFSLNDYIVKPYSIQTNLEGSPSNIAEASFSLSASGQEY